MSGAQRWRNQSLIGHTHFTGPQSPAAADGHMPVYAAAAHRIATAACAVAGMAKKRWRDQKPERLDLDRLRALRAEIDSSFAELETAIAIGTDGASRVLDEAKADASFRAFGRLGYLALANMEEAGELAQPLHALAVGAGDPETALRDAADEAADLRVYLHVTSESLSINASTSTDRKWAEVQKRWPEIFGPRARPPSPKVDMDAAIAGLVDLQKRKQP